MNKTALMVIILLVLTSFCCFHVKASSWLTGWDHRIELEIDSGDVDSDLSSFPVLIHLSNSTSGMYDEDVSCVFDEIGNNHQKLALTVGETSETFVEVETWDFVNERAWLWANVSATSATNQTLYLYYDADHANNTAYVDVTGAGNSVNVWDDDFKAVFHMTDNSTTSILDSTGYGNNGTKTSANQPQADTGLIGEAQHFNDATTDYIDCGTDASLKIVGSVTLEAWVRLDNSPVTRHAVFGRFETTNNDRSYQMEISAEGSPNVAQVIYVTELGHWTGGQRSSSYDSNFPIASWTHSMVNYNVGTEECLVYRNGTDTTEAKPYHSSTGVHAGSTPLRIGCFLANGNPVGLFDGIIDEVRISASVRPSEWVKATFESGRDHLIDFGIEETSVTPPPAQPSDAPVIGPFGPSLHRIVVNVKLLDDWVKGCNVTVEGGPDNRTEWGLTNLFGRAEFRVNTGSYDIGIIYEDYTRTIPLHVSKNVVLGIELTEDDYVVESFMEWTPETMLILVPAILVIVYALKKVADSPNRKWKYSYLK